MLQGSIWGRFQLALGRTIYSRRAEDWCWMGTVEAGRGVRYLYCRPDQHSQTSRASTRRLRHSDLWPMTWAGLIYFKRAFPKHRRSNRRCLGNVDQADAPGGTSLVAGSLGGQAVVDPV